MRVCARRGRAAGASSNGAMRQSEQALRRSAGCSSSARAPRPVTSRCRCSATATAASSCSATATARTQRRNQKVVEEAPAPGPRPTSCAPRCSTRPRALLEPIALPLGRARWSSWSTPTPGAFAFLEVNTRLQVEHAVTEAVTGVDLVEWMVRLAAGDADGIAPLRARRPTGHAIEVRVYAEDPARDYRPSAGLVTEAHWPDGRARRHVGRAPAPRSRPYYDPLLAKVVVHAADRAGAIARAGRRARRDAHRRHRDQRRPTSGRSSRRRVFVDGDGRHRRARPRTGTRRARSRCSPPGASRPCRTIPGASGSGTSACRRAGRWTTGRSALGNRDPRQPRRRGRPRVHRDRTRRCAFDADAVVCLDRRADERDARRRAGAVVRRRSSSPPARRCGSARSPARGCAPYVLVRGGIDVPGYLGSAATFTLGGFGGHGGARCSTGDVLHLGAGTMTSPMAPTAAVARASARCSRPRGSSAWSTARTARPTSSPPTVIATFFATEWTGALQLGAHRRAAGRARARSGPAPTAARPGCTRRTSTTPPYAVGRGRLHRRHADPARPRRPEPRRVRVPGHRDQRRAVEARPARARRHRALRAVAATRPATAAVGVSTAAHRTRRDRRRCSTGARRRRRRAAGHATGGAATAPCSSSTGR